MSKIFIIFLQNSFHRVGKHFFHAFQTTLSCRVFFMLLLLMLLYAVRTFFREKILLSFFFGAHVVYFVGKKMINGKCCDF